MRKIFLFISLVLLSGINILSEDIYNLNPRPKAAYDKQGQFGINQNSAIFIPKNVSAEVLVAVDYLQSFIQSAEGYKLEVKMLENYDPDEPGILMGEMYSGQILKNYVDAVANESEVTNIPEGYVLDVSEKRIILAGCTARGVYNGVSTLAQLMVPGNVTIFVQSLHIFDYPDYASRWVINFQNLRGANATGNLAKILDTMAYRKLNCINHTDFKYSILEEQPQNYFDSARRFINMANARLIEIVPGVMGFGWSSGILFRNPNLAEGLPTSAVYKIEADTGRLIPDNRVSLPNGGFENIGTNGKFSGWSFYDENFATQDLSVFHSGKASAKCTNFDGSNSRFSRAVDCQPFRGYVLSAWVKTENFSGGEVRLFAYGQEGNVYRALSFTNLDIPATSGSWMKVQVYFNTIYHEKVILYCGVWGANKGTIWWDDFEVKDLGLTNVLRRDGTPLTVENKSSGVKYTEGIDFEEVKDNIMLSKYGEYGPFHQAPTFKIKSNGKIKNGDSLLISSYHPFVAVSDNNCSGSVMACISEDTTYKIVEDQSNRVNALLNPKRFFMTHDEIRNMNWDFACQKRKLSPAELLSDNVIKCYDILKKINSKSEILLWSDMFDSLHNAYKDYYLINGDLSGIWNTIPKDIVIANWNGGKAKESLQFFADKGFKQLTSPYYDDRSTNNIRHWRIAQEGIPNVTGMMYTTWQTDYSQLTPFAYYAWGAGPAIFFEPPDSSVLDKKEFTLNAKVFSDFYDPTDKIISVKANIRFWNNQGQSAKTLDFSNSSGADFSCNISIPDSTYSMDFNIQAVNSQGLQRKSPTYTIRKKSLNGVWDFPLKDNNSDFIISPNPAEDFIEISVRSRHALTNTDIRIFNVFGKTVSTSVCSADTSASGGQRIDVSCLPSGVYFVKLGEKVGKFVKI